MRAFALAFAIILLPAAAPAADIGTACYSACAAQTTSNPEYKACLARAADAADAKLNQAYAALKGAIRRVAKELGRSPDPSSNRWSAHRRNRLPTATPIAPSRTYSLSGAPRSAATIRHASAR